MIENTQDSESSFANNYSYFMTFQKLGSETAPFKVPALPFKYDNLSPIIDKETMKFHHDKHHEAYVEKLNEAVKSKKTLGALIENASKQNEKVKNNAGGHWNHSFFWSILSGDEVKNEMSSNFKEVINKNFKDFKTFQEKFKEEGINHFGSGWVWLIVSKNGKLSITTTPNQDNPLMDCAEKRGTPILTIDLWEHAYYLDYQNERNTYLDRIWDVINWQQVESYFKQSKVLK